MTNPKWNTLSDSDLEPVCGGDGLTGGSRNVSSRQGTGSMGDFGVIEDPAPNREELETHVG